MLRFPLSRIRITTFSPKIVGSVLTRRSIFLSPTFSLMRPSCGMRRSAMSSSAMILSRLMMAFFILKGGSIIGTSTPSMR